MSHNNFRIPQQGGLKGSLPRAFVRGEEVQLNIAKQVFGSKVVAGASRAGAPGSLSVTDGVNTVAGVTSLSVSGLTVSGSTPNATITDTGGGGVAIPGTIPDLVLWIESDNIIASAGKSVPNIFDRTPWHPETVGTIASSSVTISATPLNSLNVLQWAASQNYPLSPAFTMVGGGTYFLVLNPSNAGATQAICGGSSGSMALYIGVGTANIALVKSFLAVTATSSATWTAGTWFQANVTYDAATGAYAFRQGRTAANSGTSATLGVSASVSNFGADGGGSPSAYLDGGSVVAAFIAYNRVLSPTEITNVENYLNAKWGV